MKTNIIALLGLLLAHIAYATPDIKSRGYVTFTPVADATGLVTPTQHGWSYYGSVGEVYFQHHFYSENGESFRIRDLSSSTDSDGDGVYTAFTSFFNVATPSLVSANPRFILKNNGVVLSTRIGDAVCDEVIILNHNFIGRSFSAGVRWKLETDYPDVISWTTHAPIKPFPDADNNGLSIDIQNYIGKLHPIANGQIGDIVQWSYDLASWGQYFTLVHAGITILDPPAIEPGQPKKFFRLVR